MRETTVKFIATLFVAVSTTFGTRDLLAIQPAAAEPTPATVTGASIRFYANHLDGRAIIDQNDPRRVVADVTFRDVSGQPRGSFRVVGEAQQSFVNVTIAPNQASRPLNKLCLDVVVRIDGRQRASVSGLTIVDQQIQLALPEGSVQGTTCCCRRCGLFRRR